MRQALSPGLQLVLLELFVGGSDEPFQVELDILELQLLHLCWISDRNIHDDCTGLGLLGGIWSHIKLLFSDQDHNIFVICLGIGLLLFHEDLKRALLWLDYTLLIPPKLAYFHKLLIKFEFTLFIGLCR